jgi:hypothetical protein
MTPEEQKQCDHEGHVIKNWKNEVLSRAEAFFGKRGLAQTLTLRRLP